MSETVGSKTSSFSFMRWLRTGYVRYRYVMALFGSLWSRRDSLRSHHRATSNQIGDPADRPGRPDAGETSIGLMLSDIETKACEVFARHNLPSLPGNYARSQKTQQWRFLSETLSAEERWALILAQKEGSAWRFGSLQDLGDNSDNPLAVRHAAQALRSCQQLRTCMTHPGGTDLGESLEIAIRLGETWSAIKLETPVLARRNEALKLSRPTKPRQSRAKRTKSVTEQKAD